MVTLLDNCFTFSSSMIALYLSFPALSSRLSIKSLSGQESTVTNVTPDEVISSIIRLSSDDSELSTRVILSLMCVDKLSMFTLVEEDSLTVLQEDSNKSNPITVYSMCIFIVILCGNYVTMN